MSKIVLVEDLTPSQANILTEAATDGKDLYLQGIFMMADIQNRNGRVYPLHEMAKAVETINDTIKNGYSICGELNHPDNLSINLERVSHVITEMKMVGSNAIGKAKILNTPMGNLARGLIEGGVRLGVSSRGSGNVNEDRKVSGFNFVTVDIVSDPSAHDAYPNAIREAVEQPKIMTLAEAMVHDKSAQKYFEQEIQKFLASLCSK